MRAAYNAREAVSKTCKPVTGSGEDWRIREDVINSEYKVGWLTKLKNRFVCSKLMGHMSLRQAAGCSEEVRLLQLDTRSSTSTI